VWVRRATWTPGEQVWRSDVFPGAIEDDSIVRARLDLKDGPVVELPMDDLRAAVREKEPRDNGARLFDIDLSAKTINDYPVAIEIVDPRE